MNYLSPGRLLSRVAVAVTLLASFAASATPLGLKAIQASKIPEGHVIRVVAMLDQVPAAAEVAALEALGLTVQPLKHLPMALTQGTREQIVSAVAEGVARDMYLDRALAWHSAESTAAMSADATRELGFDGSGVGVAVVDSGIDASHPDLAGRVARNVRVYSAEYLDITGLAPPGGWPHQPSLVIPFDDLPYNNTDTIGHGTHVAGIVAGEGVGDGELVGVAPGATLVGYSTGEILFIFTALAAFDDILATHEQHNVRVINNSWGSSYQLFDPDSPINVATRALYDAGMTIVFSAGNDAQEMTSNVHSNAPWVINSGSATVSKEKSGFSSSGLMFDNTVAMPLDADAHVRIEGDGLGLSHPDVSAPGSNIVSACTPTGAIVCGVTLPGGSASASGTSMSAPHMAGLAAVLLQARPELTPDQVRRVMQVTAVPMRDGAAFWQSGYGFVDARAAVDLVTRENFSDELLDSLQAESEAAMRAARPYSVVASDHWMFDQLLVTVLGLDTRSFAVEVGDGVDAIRASIAFPGDLSLLGLNLLFEWSLTLYDPDGVAVASSSLLPDVGVSVLHADFDELGIAAQPGTWSIEAVGVTNSTQPALLYSSPLTVSVTQLATQAVEVAGPPPFVAAAEMVLGFDGGSGQTSSPEGCDYDVTGVSASMTRGEVDASCHAGTVGYLVNYGASVPAEFVSEPFDSDVSVGGTATLRYYLADALADASSAGGLIADMAYQLDAVDDAGNVISAIAGGSLVDAGLAAPAPVFNEWTFDVPTSTVSAGSSLRLRMQFSGVYSSTMRLIWAGEFSDAGLTLQVAKADATKDGSDSAAVGGAMGAAGLCLMLLIGLRRRRF